MTEADAIRNVVHLFLRSSDEGDARTHAALLHPRFTYQREPTPSLEREAYLRAWHRELRGGVRWVSGLVVDVEATTAQVRAYLVSEMGVEGNVVAHLVRVELGWRLVRWTEGPLIGGVADRGAPPGDGY